MIICIENPKEFIEKQLGLISELSKVVGCQFNIQKSADFPIYQKQSEIKIKKQYHL